MNSLVFGISGQDGSYLAEYLLELGHNVYGVVRRHSVTETQSSRIEHIKDKISLLYGDVLDSSSIVNAIRVSKPDFIFNLAGQSHVGTSFEVPAYTLQVNAIGPLNIFDAALQEVPGAKIYQACTSEMFGNCVDPDGFQRSKTPMHPVSPYGIAKLAAFHLGRHYRESYGMHISSGILFNHESPRRGANFVSQKIVNGAVRIGMGLQDKLELGNLDSQRDWGHAKDYVRAMYLMTNFDVPADWIVASGQTHAIRELCEIVFSRLGLNYEEYVVQNPKYMRLSEVNRLCGDPSQTKLVLKWHPEYSFEELIDEMIDAKLSEMGIVKRQA